MASHTLCGTRQVPRLPLGAPVQHAEWMLGTVTSREPEVLTAAEVAELLQLNVDYVRRLSRQGVIPAPRIPGGRAFRYFRDEVLDWLRDQPRPGPGDVDDGELIRPSEG